MNVTDGKTDKGMVYGYFGNNDSYSYNNNNVDLFLWKVSMIKYCSMYNSVP